VEGLTTEINAAIGGLILANIATIGGAIFFGIRAVWWTSRLSFRVEQNEKDITEAHDKIRRINSVGRSEV